MRSLEIASSVNGDGVVRVRIACVGGGPAGLYFAISKEKIAAKITDKTRMIVLIKPANPTGRVYSRAELQNVADLAIEHDLLVLSDEVYEYITYGGAEHDSIASLPGMRQPSIE